jgi:hypothetical protein
VQVVLGLEGIQDGKKIYEVTRIESEPDLMDVDNKRIEDLVQGIRESLIVLDLMQVLVDLGPFDDGFCDLLRSEDLVRNMDSEGVRHVVVAVDQDHFVSRESFVGRVLGY